VLTDCFVRATLDGLWCCLAKPVVKKELATVEMLEAIMDDAEKSGSLLDLWLAMVSQLGFSALMRVAEVMELRPCNIVIAEEMMKVCITGSKMDQRRQDDKVLLGNIHVR